MQTQSLFSQPHAQDTSSKQRVLMTLVVLSLLCGFAAVWALMNPRVAMTLLNKAGGMQPGERLSGRQLPDLQGQPYAFDRLKGQNYIVMFSNAECQICKQSYPILNQLHRQYPQVQVVIVGTGSKQQFLALKESQKITFPIFLNDVAKTPLKMPKLFPLFYRVSSQGVLSQKVIGLDEQKLARLIEETH